MWKTDLLSRQKKKEHRRQLHSVLILNKRVLSAEIENTLGSSNMERKHNWIFGLWALNMRYFKEKISHWYYRLYYSIYTKCSICKLIYSDRNICGYLGTRLEMLEGPSKEIAEGHKETLRGDGCLLSSLYFKTYPSVQFKYIQSILFKL